MNSKIIFIALFVYACAVVAQAVPTPAAAETPREPKLVPTENNDREKRYLPLAYSAAVSPVITTGYSYLAPYPNSGKIIHYAAPAVYHAAYPAAYSAYHLW